jgi:formylglycine-generating enzyme required for sulfatase activity
MKNFVKITLILIVVMIVTSISIDAFDTAGGSRLTLLAQLGSLYHGSKCPSDMVLVTTAVQPFCIDRYEASPISSCPVTQPASSFDTERNIDTGSCQAASEEGRIPWQYVSYKQAETICARAGKRLPEVREWYDAALGTPVKTASCNLEGSVEKTGSKTECRSGVGTADMIGNLWEYVAGIGVDGKFGTYTVPREGYVTLADDSGLPLKTDSTATSSYDNDYAWTKTTEATVIARGGFYGARADGGIYSIQAGVSPTFSSAAIGFRCARSL